MFNDLLDARILCEVAKRKSFSGAGRALRQPPATVSRRVARMESQAGVRFFARTTRKVSVTEPGRMILVHAQRIIEESEAAQTSLEAMRDIPSGKIRISAPIILGQALLGAIVQKFLEKNPNCEAFVTLSNRRVDLVEDQYDIAIRLGPPGDLDLIIQRLGIVESGFYVSKKFERKEILQAKKPSALNNATVMLLKGNDQNVNELFVQNNANEKQSIPIQTRLISNNPMLLLQAGQATKSLMVLPCMFASEFVRKKQIKPVLAGWSVNRENVFAILTSRRFMRPAIRAFLDLLVESLKRILTQH